MKAPQLLPDPTLVQLDYLTADATGITLVMSTRRPQVACPACGQLTHRVHSRYRRVVADLPWNGLPVRLHLQTRKFFCPTPQGSNFNGTNGMLVAWGG